MIIRAVTVFVSKPSQDRLIELTEMLDEVNDNRIWTKRIALPPTTAKNLDKITDLIPQNNKILFSIAHLKDKEEFLKIKDILKTGDNFFASVLLRNPERIGNLAKFLNKMNPEESSRFAILFNDDFLTTPYFPIGSANVSVDSLGLSLRYVKDFKSERAANVLITAEEIGTKLANNLGVKYLGIDTSLSPWMDESVGELVESISSKIFSPSNLWGILELNRKIAELSINTKIKNIGFSEVMLPVGEDNLLKQRVIEGSLNLYQLLSLSFACVAGLDMVALNFNEQILTNILKDVYTIQLIKSRPYGVRLIPSQGNEKVYVKGFGEIPEIKIV
jgi:uncharacterized protein (UPF0210 family)